MTTFSPWRRRRRPLAVAAGLLVVAAVVAAAPGSGAGRSPGADAAAVRTAEQGPCLLPAAEMRRRHMDLLYAERTRAVRQGLRNPEASLTRCVSCHAVLDAGGRPVAYQDERHFCHACHLRVAIAPDCFSCHRSTPETQARAGATP
jgi:hypothetical protein